MDDIRPRFGTYWNPNWPRLGSLKSVLQRMVLGAQFLRGRSLGSHSRPRAPLLAMSLWPRAMSLQPVTIGYKNLGDCIFLGHFHGKYY